MLTELEIAKLNQALDLLGEVQVAFLRREEKKPKDERNERWRELYSMRIKLGNFIHLSEIFRTQPVLDSRAGGDERK
jgi:hypothetical protein